MTPPQHSSRKPQVSLVVAMSENRVIGRDGRLPWHLPDDLQHFKRLTLGNTIIMGRKTFDSIGRPLPQRRNIVITRNKGWSTSPGVPAGGVEVAHGLNEALSLALDGHDDDEIFIVGGEQVYRDGLTVANRIYLTLIHTVVEGDAYFPAIDESQWEITDRVEHPADAQHEHAFTFLRYDHASERGERPRP